MTSVRIGNSFSRKFKGLLLAAALLTLMCAPAALACPVPGAGRLNALKLAGQAPTAGQNSASTTDNGNHSQSIVGMWLVTLYLPDGTLFDHAFQQLHADGLEMQNSGVVPPIFENVCWGIWQQLNANTFKLKHFSWEFDADGNNIGTFVLTASATISKDGNSYTGTFVADTILPDGTLDPTQHATGTIAATRITIP